MDGVCPELPTIRLGMIGLYMPDIDNIDSWYARIHELSGWCVSGVPNYYTLYDRVVHADIDNIDTWYTKSPELS